MTPLRERCSWCLGEFDIIDGPTHEYIEAVPGCWVTYCQILTKEYENYSDLQDTHRLTVDTYAVQHPGKPSRKSIQSVWGHLVSLYYMLEQKTDGKTARQKLNDVVENKRRLEWLEPPSFQGTMTVANVVVAKNITEHNKLVKLWAKSVWDAWYSRNKDKIDAAVNE